MSTHAQIAIQTGPQEWAHVYVHYDGYPSHMLPALEAWTPEEILAAQEIRFLDREHLDAFEPPRAPRVHAKPMREMSHLYGWRGGRWVEIKIARTPFFEIQL